MRHSRREPESPRPPRARGHAAPRGRRGRRARAGRSAREAAAAVGCRSAFWELHVHDDRHPRHPASASPGSFVTAFFRRKQGKRPSFGVSLLISFATWAAVVALELLVIRHLKHLHLHISHATQPAGRAGRRPARGIQTGTTAARRRDAHAPLPLGRARRHPRAAPRGRRDRRRVALAPEPSRPERDRSRSRSPRRSTSRSTTCGADPDLRRAIIAAYARMETRPRRRRDPARTRPRRRSSTSSERSSRSTRAPAPCAGSPISSNGLGSATMSRSRR